MQSTYELINYIDVWGNETDGWEINDQCVEFKDLVITDDATDKDILNYLVDIGFLTTSDMRKLVVENHSREMIEIFEKKGMKPICRLQEVFHHF